MLSEAWFLGPLSRSARNRLLLSESPHGPESPRIQEPKSIAVIAPRQSPSMTVSVRAWSARRRSLHAPDERSNSIQHHATKWLILPNLSPTRHRNGLKKTVFCTAPLTSGTFGFMYLGVVTSSVLKDGQHHPSGAHSYETPWALQRIDQTVLQELSMDRINVFAKLNSWNRRAKQGHTSVL